MNRPERDHVITATAQPMDRQRDSRIKEVRLWHAREKLKMLEMTCVKSGA